MFRIALRNIVIMLGVALPVWLLGGMLVGWASSAARQPTLATLDELFAGFLYVYVMWAWLALGIAVIHQLILAVFPRSWLLRTTRLVILATSLGFAGSIAAYASRLQHPDVLGLSLTLIPAAIAYGLLAQPVRPSRDHTLASPDGTVP